MIGVGWDRIGCVGDCARGEQGADVRACPDGRTGQLQVVVKRDLGVANRLQTVRAPMTGTSSSPEPRVSSAPSSQIGGGRAAGPFAGDARPLSALGGLDARDRDE